MDRLDPSLKLLPCICNRRENLDLLLVNKRIHDEAAYVFWNENCFCFEHLSQLTGLAEIIRPHIKSWIRYMTIMPYTEDEHEPDRLSWMPPALSWRCLPEFTGLVDIEIDIGLLSNFKCVLGLRNLHVQRSVSFVRQFSDDDDVQEGEEEDPGTYPGCPPWYIWPERARRRIVHAPLTEALKESMRRRPLKTKVLKMAFAASGLMKRDTLV
ncbi:uncharacterized protein PFLUO_LOCUS1474 [Penicillium psychrofluorescens]|uniref:uncharacterized protein n=1 Tax=Penicillium psychrofluorescens TaxID=3158075 RepID=UPI003CCD8763